MDRGWSGTGLCHPPASGCCTPHSSLEVADLGQLEPSPNFTASCCVSVTAGGLGSVVGVMKGRRWCRCGSQHYTGHQHRQSSRVGSTCSERGHRLGTVVGKAALRHLRAAGSAAAGPLSLRGFLCPSCVLMLGDEMERGRWEDSHWHCLYAGNAEDPFQDSQMFWGQLNELSKQL